MKKILCILTLAACTVQAADYYVSTSGKDSNSGTNPNQAWKTLSKVQSMMSTFSANAQAEDVTIYFYNTDTWSFDSNDKLKITCTGTPPYWITFDGTTWGDGISGVDKARFLRVESTDQIMVYMEYGDASYDQDAYIRIKGLELDGNNISGSPLRTVNASHLEIINCEIHDTPITGGGYTPTVIFKTGKHANSINIHNITLISNKIYRSGVHGIAFYPNDSDSCSDITLQDNIIYDYGNEDGKSYASGIQVMSCVGGDISGNTIYDGSGSEDGFGIKLETRNRRCDGMDIHGNLIYGGSAIELCVGISIDGAQNIAVFNNVIRNTSNKSISWGGAKGGASGRLLNNTIYKSGSTAIHVGSTSQIDELRNNIIYQTANVPAINRSDRITEHSNNNFYNTTSGRAVVGSFTTDNWVPNWEQSGQDGNPGFLNVNALPTSFDENRNMSPTGLRVTTNGVAYNNGTDLSSVFTSDIDGNPRTSPWDIGAYQAGEGKVQIPEPPSLPRVVPDT